MTRPLAWPALSRHLRIEGARLYRGAVTCSCGEPGCTRWSDVARAVASFSGPRRRDLEQMAARKRAAEARAS